MRQVVGRVLLILLLLVLPAQPLAAEGDLTLSQPKPTLLATPPMGWSSWNRFHCNIDEALIRGIADAIVASGMRDAGYRYVNIDGCWAKGRDDNGDLVADPAKFPSGMRAMGDYLHARGLKFGLYSDAGPKTCDGSPGSAGHEFQDARTFARWGVDYLKYDWCNTGSMDTRAAYTVMAMALRASGRDIAFSLCEWGLTKPWTWAAEIGHLWRTTGDIGDFWQGRTQYEQGMLDILDQQADLTAFSGPGRWNDPDMLQVGNGGMTPTEYRTHFSLWAMLAAPLIAGNDLRGMTPEVRQILLNPRVIAIDQDAAGKPARRVRSGEEGEVWTRELAGGDWAVVLFNRSSLPRRVGVRWPQIHVPAQEVRSITDLWTGKRRPAVSGGYEAPIPAHGVVMIRVGRSGGAT